MREAFNREFVSRTGRVGENTQTAYALAIVAFDLLPDSWSRLRLAASRGDVEAREHHLTTGFLGTPHILHVLGAPATLGSHSHCSPSAPTVVAVPDHQGSRRRCGSVGTAFDPTAPSKNPG